MGLGLESQMGLALPADRVRSDARADPSTFRTSLQPWLRAAAVCVATIDLMAARAFMSLCPLAMAPCDGDIVEGPVGG